MDDKILEQLRRARQHISTKRGETVNHDERFADVFAKADELDKQAAEREKADQEVKMISRRATAPNLQNICTRVRQLECPS